MDDRTHARGMEQRVARSWRIALAAAVPDAAAAPSGPPASAAAPLTSSPSYTMAQAQAGATVYAQNCTSCHAANLQGSAGPPVAGTEFLKSVQTNGWTYADFRNLVVQQMPLNNPGTLTPKQYADVLAFLLASSCFPAGNVPFPQGNDAKLAATKIASPAAAVPGDSKLGTCSPK